MRKLIFVSCFGLFLGGCSVGQNDFNCSKGDENALCASSRTIYHATSGDIKENTDITYIKDGEVHQTNLAELESLQNPKMKISETKKYGGEYNNVPFSFSYDGNVLRKDVEVLRIWVAPFVDRNDDLHMSTLVYTDIENRKWNIGVQSSSTTSKILTRNMRTAGQVTQPTKITAAKKEVKENPLRPKSAASSK